MIRRAPAPFAFAISLGFATTCLTGGCGGPTTGMAPVAHDQDKSAGHMNHPAAGPGSPLAKAAKKSSSPPDKAAKKSSSPSADAAEKPGTPAK